jgi:hypothetical protein
VRKILLLLLGIVVGCSSCGRNEDSAVSGGSDCGGFERQLSDFLSKSESGVPVHFDYVLELYSGDELNVQTDVLSQSQWVLRTTQAAKKGEDPTSSQLELNVNGKPHLFASMESLSEWPSFLQSDGIASQPLAESVNITALKALLAKCGKSTKAPDDNTIVNSTDPELRRVRIVEAGPGTRAPNENWLETIQVCENSVDKQGCVNA